MDRYIGTKIIHAQPANKGEDLGYMVRYPDGYESWSPKAVFEDAYRRNDQLTFGLALEALKLGYKVCRAGWNGKGMFVYLVPAASYLVHTSAAKSHFGPNAMVPYNAYLAIKNVNETVSTWVPSVNDVLSEDWTLLD
jgi:Protein of unknown function (DUF2829)